MTTRRARSSHVRPRPTPSGKAAKRARVATPDPYRLRIHRGIDGRRRGLPLPARLLLGVAVVALGAVVFVTVTGGIGSVVSAIGSSFSGFLGNIVATPTPGATSLVIADAPVIASPTEPYSNQPKVDLEISLPAAVVGDPSVRVRVYLTLEGQEPAAIAEVPVGATTKLVVPVDLTDGRNDFSATIVDGGVESEPSPIVTFILDTEAPKIVLSSPQDGATINADTVEVTGKTQPRSTLIALNATNGTSVTGEAGPDGAFTLSLPLAQGSNAIDIKATDPAGNTGDLGLTVGRGSGTLSAAISASSYRISVATLPKALQLSVRVTDPNGNPLAGATVTFSLTAPGIPPVTKDVTTAADGHAVFTTTLPVGVTAGAGLASALVTTTDLGTTSDQAAITFVP